MNRSVLAVAAATVLVGLVAAPNDSSATSARPVKHDDAARPAVPADDAESQSVGEEALPEENHTRVGWSCKGYASMCRTSQECCRQFFCRIDRRRGGTSCL